MDRFMVEVSWVLSVESLRLDPGHLGVWLRLVAYCAQLETAGRLPAARGWSAGDWASAGRTTRRRVDQLVDVGLCRWVGDDLEVLAYDHHGQHVYERKRAGGRNSAERRKVTLNTLGKSPADTPVSTVASSVDTGSEGTPGGTPAKTQHETGASDPIRYVTSPDARARGTRTGEDQHAPANGHGNGEVTAAEAMQAIGALGWASVTAGNGGGS